MIGLTTYNSTIATRSSLKDFANLKMKGSPEYRRDVTSRQLAAQDLRVQVNATSSIINKDRVDDRDIAKKMVW